MRKEPGDQGDYCRHESRRHSCRRQCRLLFVYGTLMEGFYNYEKSLSGHVVSRRRARVKGNLFHQNAKGYPALLEGEDWVSGELLEVEDFEGQLAANDRLENYFGPGYSENEYERLVSRVDLFGLGEEDAWVYWYARKDLGTEANPAVRLEEGDWRKYLAAGKNNG